MKNKIHPYIMAIGSVLLAPYFYEIGAFENSIIQESKIETSSTKILSHPHEIKKLEFSFRQLVHPHFGGFTATPTIQLPNGEIVKGSTVKSTESGVDLSGYSFNVPSESIFTGRYIIGFEVNNLDDSSLNKDHQLTTLSFPYNLFEVKINGVLITDKVGEEARGPIVFNQRKRPDHIFISRRLMISDTFAESGWESNVQYGDNFKLIGVSMNANFSWNTN